MTGLIDDEMSEVQDYPSLSPANPMCSVLLANRGIREHHVLLANRGIREHHISIMN
jgi:hypothetical protein